MAKERTKTIAELVKGSQRGTVIIYGGVTNENRTRSTAEVYTQELKNILFKDKEDMHFIGKRDILNRVRRLGHLKAAKNIASEINGCTLDQRVLIDLPLSIKEFFMSRYLYERDGKTERLEWKKLIDKHKPNYTEAIKEWFGNPELIKLVDPETIAKDYIYGMQRFANFSRRFIPNRPLKIGLVGHSFLIDALLTYVANKEKISPQGFEKIGGHVVRETELSILEFDQRDNLRLRYRGKNFILPVAYS